MKRFSLQNLSLEFAIGVFFFVALAVLAYFTVVLSKEMLFEKRRNLALRFPEVAGLAEGDAVLLRGVNVGTVEHVRLIDNEVLVEATVRKEVDLFSDASADIKMSSVLGGQYLALQPGIPSMGPLPEDQIIAGRPPADVLAQVSDIIRDMKTEMDKVRDAFDENQILPKLTATVDHVHAITGFLRNGEGTLGKLLTDDSLHATASDAAVSIKNAGEHVTNLTETVNTTVTEARAGRGTLGKLLTDDTLYTETSGLVTDLRAGKGTLGKLITDDALYDEAMSLTGNLRDMSESAFKGESSFAKLANDQGALYNDLSAAFNSAREIADNVKSGQGTLGKFVTDEELYQDLRKAVNDVRAAVEDFREQAPVGTFGGLVFGAF